MIIQGKKIRVYDNGARYTIIIDGSVFAMNSEPFHPAYGFSQYCGEISEYYHWDETWGKEIHDINLLPEDTVKAIILRFDDES